MGSIGAAKASGGSNINSVREGINQQGETVWTKIDPVLVNIMGKDKVVDGKLKVNYGHKLSTIEDYNKAKAKVEQTRDKIESASRVEEKIGAGFYSYLRDGTSKLLVLYQNEVVKLNQAIQQLQLKR